jgi:hypothetical protein
MIALREIAESWSTLYSNSAVIRSTLAFVHVSGLVAGGGTAIVADRAMLRAIRRGGGSLTAEVERLHTAHRAVLAGLAAVSVSGLLLMLADFDAYVVSIAFWIKMALVAALLLNGAWLARIAALDLHRSAPNWRRLRVACLLSLLLWFATTLLGTTLPNVV